MGLAMYNGILLEPCFPLALYRLWLLFKIEQNFATGVENINNLNFDSAMQSTADSLKNSAITAGLRRRLDHTVAIATLKCDQKKQEQQVICFTFTHV